ncbi:hypothetical protein JXJ21_03745 [candidate division KSB1 bacterium]|nr:hypothetical protein [candidate division KSB1 bacterium]
MSKLATSGQDGKEYFYLFENTTPVALGQEVNTFFQKLGYKLEEGTNQFGIYGTGSPVLRVLFGAFAKRYKFNVAIRENAKQVKLTINEAMSGYSGGLIGKSKMKKEFQKITEAIKTNLA